MRLGSWSSAVALVLVVLGVEGCCGRFSKCGPDGERPEVDPGAPRALPPPRTGGLPSSPDLAVVVTKDGVVAIDAQGVRVQLVAPQTDVSWCRVDPVGRVLWLRHGEQGSLSLVDLESDAPPIAVLERAPETVIIAYRDHELGRPEAHLFQDAVVVRMDDPPRVEAALGCDGDQAYYCFGEEIEDFEAAEAKRLSEIRAMLEGQPLLGREALAKVYQRSAGASPAVSPQSPEPELVRTVPREPCTEEPGDCGRAVRLPGTPYWRVVVANSRGDFFHETHQLYDPATSEFFDPRDPRARSRQPLAESGETFTPSWVSPSGELALDHDTLVRLQGGILASGFDQICGFWGGGWEVVGR